MTPSDGSGRISSCALASRRERKDDTRRKILVSALVRALVDQGVLEERLLRTWLDAALTRADDRTPR